MLPERLWARKVRATIWAKAVEILAYVGHRNAEGSSLPSWSEMSATEMSVARARSVRPKQHENSATPLERRAPL